MAALPAPPPPAGWTAAPWLATLQPHLDAVVVQWRAGATVAEALHARLDGMADGPVLAVGRLRFVPQAELPAGEAYEAFIHRTACVPTRDNLHDLLNGLVWLCQPDLKRRLNELQASKIARDGIGARRGAARDALTLIDENGALLQAPEPLWQALRSRDWHGLFTARRGLWSEARLTIVGHALLEQLAMAPRKGLTAHVLCADPLALGPEGWAAKPFTPLPVLGIPGWCDDNARPVFYDDPQVFRARRAG